MEPGRDAMMLVRADLCDRLASLQAMSKRAPRHQWLGQISAIRQIAAAYGLTPVVRLADAVDRAVADAGSTEAARLYLDRLHDAIGCTRLDEGASEALIASVSVRLGA